MENKDKMVCSEELMDMILRDFLVFAPTTQIEPELKTKILKFNAIERSPSEKYDFIMAISRLKLGSSAASLQPISSFVYELCKLDAYYLRPEGEKTIYSDPDYWVNDAKTKANDAKTKAKEAEEKKCKCDTCMCGKYPEVETTQDDNQIPIFDHIVGNLKFWLIIILAVAVFSIFIFGYISQFS